MLSIAPSYAGSTLILAKPGDSYFNNKALVILDARPKAMWLISHVPGALSFSWENLTRTDDNGVPYRIPPVADMADTLGRLGIDEKTDILVYGDADSSWGGEGWVTWLFTYLGHKGRIGFLEGGFPLWEKKGFPLEKRSGNSLTNRKIYHPAVDNRVIISTSELNKNLKNLQVVDTRSFLERLRGSIKGSVNIPWEKFHKGEDRIPIDGAALKKLLADHGIDPSKPVVYYCTGGIRSAYAWTVHRLSGAGPAQNYEEGMEGWSRR
jgi:thiosulfate/3-mercaptopyruvate sulfurtransferase